MNAVTNELLQESSRLRRARRQVLVGVSVLMAGICAFATQTTASLPNAGLVDVLSMGMFVPAFLIVLGVGLWQDRWLDRASVVLFALMAAVAAVRVAQIARGPIFESPSLPVFMPIFAFVPLVYVGGVLLASARAATVGNVLFWLALLWLVVPPLWPVLQQPDAQLRGAPQLLYWLVLANPAFIVLLYLVLRVRSAVEHLERDNQSMRERTALATELEESKTRLDLAIAGSADGMWDWLDVRRDEVWWSPRYYELIGHAPEDLPASFDSFRQIVHPEDLPAVDAAMRAHLEQGTPYRVEFRARDAGGVYRWFAARGRALRGADGRPVRMAGSLRDIHDQKLAEADLHKAQEQLQKVLDFAPSAIYTKDLQGRYRLVNKRWCKYVGPDFEPHMAVGKTDADVFNLDAAEQFGEQDRQVAATGEPMRLRETVTLAGEEVALLTEKFPLRNADGDIDAVGGISTEITDLEQAQAELSEANADLERFAYIVSHDLNAPLRAIGGFASLMRRKHADELGEGAVDYLDQIDAGVASMRRMIDAILDLSQVGRQKAMGATDLSQVVHEALGRVAALVDEAQARVELGSLPDVFGNHDQLVLLFQNLLQNAIKFRKPDQRLRVELDGTTDGETARLTVRDNGIGIAAEDHGRIFGIFQKLHHEQDYAGQGMGLAICEKIVQAHGGTISVDGALGEGACFHITLPARAPEDTA